MPISETPLNHDLGEVKYIGCSIYHALDLTFESFD